MWNNPKNPCKNVNTILRYKNAKYFAGLSL